MGKGISLSGPCYPIANGKGKSGNRPCYFMSDETCECASGHCQIVPPVTFKNISLARLVHVRWSHSTTLANPANSSDMK